MGTVALDASIIIAFLYRPDSLHEVAIDLLAPWLEPVNRILIPASVYSEVLVGPLWVGAANIVEAFIVQTESELVPIDRSIARRGAALRAEYRGLRLPDALALATAIEHGATFLTLDDGLRRIVEQVR